MNASKFVSDISHQHNTLLHSYLHQPSSSLTSSSIATNVSSQQQRTMEDAKPVHSTNNTVSLKHIDEEVQSSLPDQIRNEVTGIIDKNYTQLPHNSKSIAKNVSKKNFKHNSADIQSYFIKLGKITTELHVYGVCLCHPFPCILVLTFCICDESEKTSLIYAKYTCMLYSMYFLFWIS